ncbi:Prephenate dehydratase protein [Dioscorea alata]|uniref:Prephenate dehydratase protein n=3 Tax=Dioscorea alata TaxID=55571 RepID=A0ACB7UNP2_DIOAL|nr:Prephenate dehydratase protein [Dioscorea alata]
MLDGGKMISLDGVGILGGGGGLICLKRRDLGRSYGVCFLKWRYGRPLCAKPVEDESVPVPISAAELSRVAGNAEALERGRWNRESNALPRQLSATDLVAPSQGLNIRVAYQGLPGAFSEAAALKAYPLCETVPCEEFDVTFKAVEMSVVDRAVLPIENSSDGSIHRNYDLLLSHRLHIVGEVQLAVNHCLMALPGVKKEGIKRVLSHPNALAQCEFKLNKLEVIQQNMHDTAGAAQIIASDNLRDAGAIASVQAAEIYGLNILEKGMQDLSDNVTRFLILAREPIIPGTDRPFKTSIVFTLDEGPGVLFKALAVFSLRNISLTKIESRPQRKRPLKVVTDSNHGTAKYFDYLFYIDFEASMIEPRAQNALAHLQEFATFLHVLGSYPKDTSKCFSQEKL